MAFKISVRSEENEKLSAVLVDLITSAAFFGKRDIEVEQEREELSFIFHGHCPNEYLTYLNWKYDLSLDYIC